VKVYLQPPQPSLGLDRIATALRRYAPSTIEVCEFPRNVDLTVIYAIGRRDAVLRQISDIRRLGKQYAVIQCCLRSTMNPSTGDWFNIWYYAKTVWSYYDLSRLIYEDGNDWVQWTGSFYHAPLGADASVFYDRFQPNRLRWYTIVTSGLSRLSESVRECELATEIVDESMFHLGPKISNKSHVFCKREISDRELAEVYSNSSFVSGLRRTEGFELPAAEGLLCGARPIVFDTPDYRWNYREFAEYIHEGTRAEVVDQLVQLFKQGARPVTAHEREEAAHWFSWERVCGEFWQKVLG
jgi:hypothetical protein